MSQKLPVNGFEWTESMLDEEDPIKTIMKIVTHDIFLKWILKILKIYIIYSDLQFLPEGMKINKCRKLMCNLYDKE